MRPGLILIALSTVSAPLCGQFFTSSPANHEFVEGSSDSRDVVGSLPQLRFQQVDSTSGPRINIGKLALRRDARLFTNPQYGARTIDAEIVFAESSVENLSTDFAANRIANSSVVVGRKLIQLPDWSQMPPFPPASLNAIIPLDVPWTYAGKQASGNDFLWEIRVWSNSAAGQDYPLDLTYVVPNATFGQSNPTRSGHVDLGSGCQVALGEAHLDVDVFNYGDKFTLDAHLHTAPNAPVTLMIGPFDANLTHPLLCSKLHVSVGAFLPVGVAGPTGDFDIDIDPIGYDATWIGQDLYFQTLAPDSTQPGTVLPVALSSGAKLTIPGDPQGPAVGRVWALDPDATTATFGPEAGGVIVLTSQ